MCGLAFKKITILRHAYCSWDPMATISGETTALQGKHHNQSPAVRSEGSLRLQLPALGQKNGPYATQLFNHYRYTGSGPDIPDPLQLWTRSPLHEHYDYARLPLTLTREGCCRGHGCFRGSNGAAVAVDQLLRVDPRTFSRAYTLY